MKLTGISDHLMLNTQQYSKLNTPQILLTYQPGKRETVFHPKGNQSRIVTGRTDAEAEIPILWLPDEKN